MRGVHVAALARCVDNDIDTAARALRHAEQPRLHVFLATSDLHLEKKLRISRAQAVERVYDGITRARRLCDDIEFSAEDASRSDRVFLAKVFSAAIAAGARTINVPDTVGYATASATTSLIVNQATRSSTS